MEKVRRTEAIGVQLRGNDYIGIPGRAVFAWGEARRAVGGYFTTVSLRVFVRSPACRRMM
jgi:hypothetical protein